MYRENVILHLAYSNTDMPIMVAITAYFFVATA